MSNPKPSGRQTIDWGAIRELADAAQFKVAQAEEIVLENTVGQDELEVVQALRDASAALVFCMGLCEDLTKTKVTKY